MVNTNDAEFVGILAVDDACSYGLDPQEAATLVHQTKIVRHHLTFAYHWANREGKWERREREGCLSRNDGIGYRNRADAFESTFLV